MKSADYEVGDPRRATGVESREGFGRKSSASFIASCVAVERNNEDFEIDLETETRVSPTSFRLHATGVKGFLKVSDMIDQLPEALILKILSSLPTKTVLSTSSSSKEWQSRWKSVPKFEFNSEDYESEHQTFPEVVSKSFFSSEAAVLDCFHLTCGSDQVDPVDVVHWIDTAFARQLRTLVLDFISDDDEYLFTSRLCNCDTLETLKLGSMIIVDVSSPGSMKSLKTLHTYAWYQNDESILNLLSSCRILEELVVGRSAEHTVSFFTIEVPSLKRLVIYDDNSCTEFFGYTIVAPSLKYLKIEELRCPQFSLNAPDLVEANIAGVSSGINESLASVRRLFLDLSPSELVYLQIYTHEPDWYDLLTWMLERSPKLQVLKLVDEYTKHRVSGWEWNKPKDIPECLLLHLETLVWTRYDWRKENEE
ncbi:hypothetical protein Bca101_088120 [Brassica carinata]